GSVLAGDRLRGRILQRVVAHAEGDRAGAHAAGGLLHAYVILGARQQRGGDRGEAVDLVAATDQLARLPGAVAVGVLIERDGGIGRAVLGLDGVARASRRDRRRGGEREPAVLAVVEIFVARGPVFGVARRDLEDIIAGLRGAAVAALDHDVITGARGDREIG